MKVILSPWSKVPKNGVKCAKNFPLESWKEVVLKLREKGFKTIQIGVSGEQLINAEEVKFNLSFPDLLDLLKSADTFISVDNGIQHFAHYYGIHGVVIFSKSDPSIFGYSDNKNLLKDKKYLRQGREQFKWWDECPYDKDAFISSEEVVDAVESVIKEKVKG